MANKYLEKIAALNLITGYLGADKGDKVGGTLIGGTLGGMAGVGAGAAVGIHHIMKKTLQGHNPSSLAQLAPAAGLVVGGYLGGKAYSKIKDAFRSQAAMKEHLALNGKKND